MTVMIPKAEEGKTFPKSFTSKVKCNLLLKYVVEIQE
jgi:hypothetical protein